MAKFIILVVALFAIQGCLAKPKAKPESKTPVEEITATANTVVKTVQNALGIDDNHLEADFVVKTIQNHTQLAADTVKDMATKLKTEISAHQGDANTLLTDVQTKLNELAASMQKAAGPEATGKANQMKADFEKNIKSAVAQVEKLAKDYKPQIDETKVNMDKVTKSFMDTFADIANNIQSQIKDAVKAHEATHKH